MTALRPADLRVVFMGTPEFAVPCLEALFGLGCAVVGPGEQERDHDDHDDRDAGDR